MKTPELDKLLKVSDASQKIGEFLDWINQSGISLCKIHDHTEDCEGDNVKYDCGYSEESYAPIHSSINELLSDYFKINTKKAESERQAILQEIRK